MGIFASYFGEAVELRRHCDGAGQQLVIGLFLASIAWLDRATWPRSRAICRADVRLPRARMCLGRAGRAVRALQRRAL